MIALCREYPSVFDTPIIRAIDIGIFRYRYFTHCMSCTFCSDACCSYGVDIDIENTKRIAALGEDFAAHVGVPREQWFEQEIWKDPEFPGGSYTRTQTVDGACVFLDRKQRGCKIHAYCLEKDTDYHLLKPLVSVLFPLTFEDGVLVASSEVEQNELVCAGSGPSLYEGVRGELAYYFGDAFVAELDSIRQHAIE